MLAAAPSSAQTGNMVGSPEMSAPGMETKRKRQTVEDHSYCMDSSAPEMVPASRRGHARQRTSTHASSAEVGTTQQQRQGAPRVVSLLSSDPLGDTRRHEAQALERHRRERQQGERGRAVDFQGRDLDRAAGGAFHAGRR